MHKGRSLLMHVIVFKQVLYCTREVHMDMSVRVRDLFFMGASILPGSACVREDVHVERL